MAQLVDQDVFECTRAGEHQGEIERDRAVGGQRTPLRAHHLQGDARGWAWQRRQQGRQPATDVRACFGFIEITQRPAQRGDAQVGGHRGLQPVVGHGQAQGAAFVPGHRQVAAAQRDRSRGMRLQRRRGVAVVRQLRHQPVAVFEHETLAGDLACAQRQGQARPAFAHAELDPARARIAHAQHGDGLAVVQDDVEGFARRPARLRAGFACEQAEWIHAVTLVMGQSISRCRRGAAAHSSARPCEKVTQCRAQASRLRCMAVARGAHRADSRPRR